MNSPLARALASAAAWKPAGFTLGYLYESRGDTPLLSRLSRERDGVKGAGWVAGCLRTGVSQEVVAKSPLTSDWHAPETGRAAPPPAAACYDC